MKTILKQMFCALACALSLLVAGPASAAALYSIDVISESLVTVDAQTGGVSVIGGLGLASGELNANGFGIAMAYHGGSLYALRRGADSRLYRIDPFSGAVLSNVAVSTSGAFNYAEGLASFGGSLMISIRSGGGTNVADAVAALDPTAGTVSGIVNFGTTDDNDFLFATGTSLFAGVDTGLSGGGGSGSNIYAMDLSGPTRTLTASLSNTELPGNSWGWDAFQGGIAALNADSIFLFDSGFAFTSSAAYDTGTYTLRGLASIPEPGVLILFGIGLAGLLGSRRR